MATVAAFEFLLRGAPLRQQDGYRLFSGLCKKHPWLHSSGVLIAPVRGTRRGDFIELDENSVLHMRGITEDQALEIAGSYFTIAHRDHDGIGAIKIGRAEPCLLHPSKSLVSRLVLLDTTDRALFERRLERLLPGVCYQTGSQKYIKVHGEKRYGFSVLLSDLEEQMSLSILSTGIGGCRSMGCGVFYTPREQA